MASVGGRAAYQLWAHFHQRSRKSIIVSLRFLSGWRRGSKGELRGFGLHGYKFRVAAVAK